MAYGESKTPLMTVKLIGPFCSRCQQGPAREEGICRRCQQFLRAFGLVPSPGSGDGLEDLWNLEPSDESEAA